MFYFCLIINIHCSIKFIYPKSLIQKIIYHEELFKYVEKIVFIKLFYFYV